MNTLEKELADERARVHAMCGDVAGELPPPCCPTPLLWPAVLAALRVELHRLQEIATSPSRICQITVETQSTQTALESSASRVPEVSLREAESLRAAHEAQQRRAESLQRRQAQLEHAYETAVHRAAELDAALQAERAARAAFQAETVKLHQQLIERYHDRGRRGLDKPDTKRPSDTISDDSAVIGTACAAQGTVQYADASSDIIDDVVVVRPTALSELVHSAAANLMHSPLDPGYLQAHTAPLARTRMASTHGPALPVIGAVPSSRLALAAVVRADSVGRDTAREFMAVLADEGVLPRSHGASQRRRPSASGDQAIGELRAIHTTNLSTMQSFDQFLDEQLSRARMRKHKSSVRRQTELQALRQSLATTGQ